MIVIESIFVNSIVNDGDPANFIVIESNFVGGGGGGGGTWGSIVGTLSNQTDLQSALDAKVPYTGATGNVTLGEYGLTNGYTQFDTTPTQAGGVGRLIWNDTDGTLNLGLKGGNVTLQIGQEEVVRVVNKTGSSLNESAYQVVRVSTAQGQRLGVQLAQANNDANSADTLGIVTETIANNQEGFITVSGLVNNINTTGSLQSETWADGDLLFLSPTTAGAITNVRPTAPDHTVILGYVVYAHANNGKIFVKVDNGYELDELHNVKITTPTNGQVLKYNSTLTVWENATDAGGVTSVAMTVPTGLTISGSPITSAGTLALTYTTGYSIPTTTKQSNWDDAYTFVGNFPTQTGNNGKYLTTDGSSLSWGTINLSGYVPTSRTLTINGTSFDLSADRSWTISTGISIGTTVTSATTGSILFAGASSALSQDNTNLFWDDTNNRLGIGTNAPANTLDVRGFTKVTTASAGATTLQAVGTTGNLMTVTDASTGTILTVNGSAGTLMTVTDAVTGNIFNVNDSGGTTRFRVNSNGAIYQNSITVTGFASATNTIISIDKTTGNSARYDYVLWNASTGAYRAGTVTAVWDGTNISFSETTTTDIVASTSAVTLSADISGANTRLMAAVSSGTWNIRIGARIV